MPTIVVVEPHTLYRLGIVRLLTDALPEAKLLGLDYDSLHHENEQQRCELLLLSIPSAEESHVLLNNAQSALQPEAILLMADTQSALPSPYEAIASVRGHLLKSASLELMIASVNLVLAGGRCFHYPTPMTIEASISPALPLSVEDPEILSSTLVKLYEPMRWPPDEKATSTLQMDESQLLGITPRQYEVLVLLARGMTIKGLAQELNISAATAKAHAETLYTRMNVSNRNEAVYQAVTKGARLCIPNETSGFGPFQA